MMNSTARLCEGKPFTETVLGTMPDLNEGMFLPQYGICTFGLQYQQTSFLMNAARPPTRLDWEVIIKFLHRSSGNYDAHNAERTNRELLASHRSFDDNLTV